MKEIRLYCCEICGAKYDDKEKAKLCEESHKIPVVCKGGRWKTLTEPQSPVNAGYPLRVIVEFKDGSKAEYDFAGRIGR